MGKTNLKIEYVLKAANNIGFDNIDTYISKIIFEHYNKIPTYTLEKMLSILNVSKPKFKAYLNQIGYKNFTAFKDEIIFEKIVRIKQIRERYDKFEKDKILSVINQLRKSPIDMNDIDGICYEINKHDRFIVYGSPTLLNLLFDLCFSKSSSLYNEWLEKGYINETFSASFTQERDYAFILIGGDQDDYHLLQKTIFDFIEHIDDLVIEQEDFERIKRKTIGNFINSYNSPESIANSFSRYYFEGICSFELVDYVSKITIADLNEVKKYFNKEYASTYIVKKDK